MGLRSAIWIFSNDVNILLYYSFTNVPDIVSAFSILLYPVTTYVKITTATNGRKYFELELEIAKYYTYASPEFCTTKTLIL